MEDNYRTYSLVVVGFHRTWLDIPRRTDFGNACPLAHCFDYRVVAIRDKQHYKLLAALRLPDSNGEFGNFVKFIEVSDPLYHILHI